MPVRAEDSQECGFLEVKWTKAFLSRKQYQLINAADRSIYWGPNWPLQPAGHGGLENSNRSAIWDAKASFPYFITLSRGLMFPNSDFALKRTFGNIWRQFWLSQLGQGRCYPRLAVQSRGNAKRPQMPWNSSSQPRNIWPDKSTVTRLRNPFLKECSIITWSFRDRITLRVYKWGILNLSINEAINLIDFSRSP